MFWFSKFFDCCRDSTYISTKYLYILPEKKLFPNSLNHWLRLEGRKKLSGCVSSREKRMETRISLFVLICFPVGNGKLTKFGLEIRECFAIESSGKDVDHPPHTFEWLLIVATTKRFEFKVDLIRGEFESQVEINVCRFPSPLSDLARCNCCCFLTCQHCYVVFMPRIL